MRLKRRMLHKFLELVGPSDPAGASGAHPIQPSCHSVCAGWSERNRICFWSLPARSLHQIDVDDVKCSGSDVLDPMGVGCLCTLGVVHSTGYILRGGLPVFSETLRLHLGVAQMNSDI